MCIVATSESGHGGRFEPCEKYKRMKKEYAATTLSLCEANKNRRDDIERLEAENAKLRQECSGLDAINRNCVRENEQLRNELARTQQERDRLAGIVEKADALLKEARTVASDRVWNACEAYQEARHG